MRGEEEEEEEEERRADTYLLTFLPVCARVSVRGSSPRQELRGHCSAFRNGRESLRPSLSACCSSGVSSRLGYRTVRPTRTRNISETRERAKRSFVCRADLFGTQLPCHLHGCARELCCCGRSFLAVSTFFISLSTDLAFNSTLHSIQHSNQRISIFITSSFGFCLTAMLS